MEKFNIDLAHILQDRDFTVLQELESHFYNFRTKVAAKIEEVTAYEIEFAEKRTSRAKKISELQHELESLESDIDTTKLQQKILDKKILNAIQRQEKLQVEVDKEKLKRDNLSIEMIDLQQESAKRKENKLSTWNAIKRACYIYKQYLDFRIHLIDSPEFERIKVSFLITEADANDKYFAHLIHSNEQWRVELLQPKIETEDLNDFKGIVDFLKNSEVSDITAFLCKLRHIFVKYYFDKKDQ